MSPPGLKGGLVLFWHDNINISILSYSPGHIDCIINDPINPFYFMGFYGNPKHNDHFLSWSLLNKISLTHTNTSFGWLVGGDFSEILYDHEKRGVNPRAYNLINKFCEALNSNSLTNIPSAGAKYTWDNKRKAPN